MKLKVILLSCLISFIGCKESIKHNTIRDWKNTKDGYLIPSGIEEFAELKTGQCVRLNSNEVFTVEKNIGYISSDEGKTWKEHSIVVDSEGFDVSPGALIKTKSGVLILSFTNNKERDRSRYILPTYVIRSIDEGRTWIDLKKLHDEWTGANRDIIETKDGSVVFTSQKGVSEPVLHNAVLTYVTKDDGKTWNSSNLIDLGGFGGHSGLMESTIVQLNNGRIWQLIRTNWGNFWQAFSYDNGLTWEGLGPTSIDASSAPAIIKRLNDGRLILVWNQLFPKGTMEYQVKKVDSGLAEIPSNWQREELSVAFSDNEGLSWSEPIVVAKNPKGDITLAYPYIFEINPGEIWLITSFLRGTKGYLRIKFKVDDLLKKSIYN